MVEKSECNAIQFSLREIKGMHKKKDRGMQEEIVNQQRWSEAINDRDRG